MVKPNGNDTRSDTTRTTAEIKRRLSELNNPTLDLIANAFSASAPAKLEPDEPKMTILAELIDSEKTLALVPLQSIHVDMDAHRLNIGHMQDIINSYQHDLVGAIILSKRADGELYIIDGLHKAVAAFVNGYKSLLSIVFYEMTASTEIRMFLAMHENTYPIRPHDHFRMSLVTRDPAAIAVKAVCDKYQLDTNERRNDARTYYLAGIKTAYDITKQNNNDAAWLEWTLSVLRDIGWLYTRPNATGHAMLTAIEAAYAANPDKAAISSILCKITPYQLNKLAAEHYPHLDSRACLKMFLTDIVNGDFTQEDLYPENTKNN